MKRLRIVKETPHRDAIAEAVAVLQGGGILVYPTDTCYGLGADAHNAVAVRRLIQMKQRNLRAKPFSVIVSSIDELSNRSIAQTDPRTTSILHQYLPGPFTFVLINLDFRISRSSSLGIRIPSCATTSMLASSLRGPYITTSANVSGLASPYSYEDLEQFLLNPLRQANQSLPDLVLDAGPLPLHPPSTVVDLTSDPPRILRQGLGIFRDVPLADNKKRAD